MKSWRKEIRLKKTFFVVADRHLQRETVFWLNQMMGAVNKMRAYRYINEKQCHQKRISLFAIWLKFLDKNKVRTLAKFKRKKILRICLFCFSFLKKYTNQKLKFRSDMKKLLKLRANNILRLAFCGGLKYNWHQKIIEKNLNEAAVYLKNSRMMRKPFLALKKRR